MIEHLMTLLPPRTSLVDAGIHVLSHYMCQLALPTNRFFNTVDLEHNRLILSTLQKKRGSNLVDRQTDADRVNEASQYLHLALFRAAHLGIIPKTTANDPNPPAAVVELMKDLALLEVEHDNSLMITGEHRGSLKRAPDTFGGVDSPFLDNSKVD